MRTYYIYKATNKINGKIYIGQTVDFEKRKKEHELDRRNKNSIFHRAIDKYGIENFEWEIIDSFNSKYGSDYLERFYIELYKSYKPNGYNMTKGGDGGSMWNARPVVSFLLDGTFVKRYDSAEGARTDGFCGSDVLVSCKNPNRTTKGHVFMFEDDYKENGFRGYKKPDSVNMKAVIQCDKKGNFINRFKSIREASGKTGANRTTISGALTGTYKFANGFIFVYEEDFPIKDMSKYVVRKKGRRVAQVDVESGLILKIYDRIADAGRELCVSYKAIHKVVDLEGRTAYGYKWISIS